MTRLGQRGAAEHVPGTSREAVALNEAMASFRAPPGWRVLWTDGRLEAHWTSGGSWARYSMRFHGRGELETDDEVFFSTDSGRGRLTVTFTSSDLLPETMAAAADMLSPMQQLLVLARIPGDQTLPTPRR